VLTWFITPELVDEVVERAGCREERWRLLPARVMVYFVLGMCLLSSEGGGEPPGYRAVMRSLSHGVRHLAGLAVPSAAALCKARQRLGSLVFELLLEVLQGPLAAAGDVASHAFGLRVVAWDATEASLPASAPNLAAIRRHRCRDGDAGQPQYRLLAIVECGTRAVIDAAFDALTAASEQALARRVLASLRPGMLLLADRNFPGWELWGLAASTGAELCWRARSALVMPPLEPLPDGSYISVMPSPEDGKHAYRIRAAGKVPRGRRARVIEYQVTITRDGQSRTERARLLTTILDWQKAPAADLAACYHQRWEAEGFFLDIKSRLKGSGLTLRSRDPEMAAQEMLAFLCTAQALAALRHHAAATAGLDPDRASFTVTLRIARDHARTQDRILAPGGLQHALATATADILASLLPPRRQRQCPREQKSKRVRFPKGKDPQRPAGNITYNIEITPPASHNAVS
jgi:hypothetical protein